MLGQGYLSGNNIARRVRGIGKLLLIGLGHDHVEYVGAGHGVKGAAVDIHIAAGVLTVVQGLGIGVLHIAGFHLDDRVADIGGGAVADEIAVVNNQGAAVGDLGHGALDAGGGAAALIAAKQAGNTLHQIEGAVYHIADLILVPLGGGDGLLGLGQLGPSALFLGGLVLAAFVLAGLVALGSAVLGAVVLAVLLLGNGLLRLLGLVALFAGGGGSILLGVLGAVLAGLLGGGALVTLAVVIALGILIVLGQEELFLQVQVSGFSGADTGGVLQNVGAQNHCLTNDILQLGPAEITLELILLTAGLEFAAVDHHIAVQNMENVPVGVVQEVPLLVVDHACIVVDPAGILLGSAGVDHGQGRALRDLEHIGMVTGNGCILISIGVSRPINQALFGISSVVNLKFIAVQVQNLVAGNFIGTIIIIPTGIKRYRDVFL